MIRLRIHQQAAALDITKIGELANLAGVHYTTISPLWNNTAKRIDLETLDKVCTALKCPPSELFEQVEAKPTPKKKKG